MLILTVFANLSAQRRPGRYNRIHRGGALQRRYLTDAWASTELNKLNWIRAHQKNFRQDKFAAFEDMVANDDDPNSFGRSVTKLPASHQGGPRNMKMTMQDSMALCRRFGNPSLFLTFTCDPLWPEIASCLETGMEYQDCPDVICRVFKQFLDELMKDLIELKIFGKVAGYSYVIEFQKRGLPHAHIVLILSREDRITTKEQVDAAVQADIPDPNEDKELYDLVMKHMVHPLCGQHRNSVCIDPSTKKCTKKFPKVTYSKPLQAITSHHTPFYIINGTNDV